MSYMLSIATKRGAILAADSRGNFYRDNQPVAHYDTVQKVFRVNNKLGLATTNNEFIEGKSVSGLLNKFIRLYGEKTGIKSIIKDLAYFIKHEFRGRIPALFLSQQFIIAGYDKGGRLLRKDGTLRESIDVEDFSVIKSSGRCGINLPESTENFIQEEVKELAVEIINDFIINQSYLDGVEPWKRIGGPIDILWVPKKLEHRACWLKKKRFKKVDSMCDFLAWATHPDKVKIIEPHTREELEMVIEKLRAQSGYS